MSVEFTVQIYINLTGQPAAAGSSSACSTTLAYEAPPLARKRTSGRPFVFLVGGAQSKLDPEPKPSSMWKNRDEKKKDVVLKPATKDLGPLKHIFS